MKFFINIAAFYWVLFFYILDNQVFILKYYYLDMVLSFFMYFIIGIILGLISLFITIRNTKNKQEDNIEINKMYPIYTELIPVYLSIVMIATSLNTFDSTNDIATIIIFIAIFIFFKMSNIGYINPVWYLIGYRIFKIDNEKAIYILIIHKNDTLKGLKQIKNINRIDEYTFIKKR